MKSIIAIIVVFLVSKASLEESIKGTYFDGFEYLVVVNICYSFSIYVPIYVRRYHSTEALILVAFVLLIFCSIA